MTAIFTVAGIAVASDIIQKVLDAHGHGDKAPFIKLLGYVACAGITFDVLWDGIHYVAHMFGVRL